MAPLLAFTTTTTRLAPDHDSRIRVVAYSTVWDGGGGGGGCLQVRSIPITVISTNFSQEYNKLKKQREAMRARILLLRSLTSAKRYVKPLTLKQHNSCCLLGWKLGARVGNWDLIRPSAVRLASCNSSVTGLVFVLWYDAHTCVCLAMI